MVMTLDKQPIFLVDEIIPTDNIFYEFLALEKSIDAKIVAKQIDMADAAFKMNRIRRCLKLFISSTTEGFGEQREVANVESSGNHSSSNSGSNSGSSSGSSSGDNSGSKNEIEASSEKVAVVLRIEGKLETYGRQGRGANRKFSSFFSNVLVQIGTDESKDTVEWNKKKNRTASDCDGFEIKRVLSVNRKGEEKCPIKIILTLENQPEKYRLSPELAEVLDQKMGTKPAIVLALWQYIKLYKLQESDEKKMVNNNEALQRIFGIPKMSFSAIPALLEPHLLPIEPITIDYAINLNIDNTETPMSVYDLDVEMEDPLKGRLPSSSTMTNIQRDIAILEGKMNEVIAGLRTSVASQNLLAKFADDPIKCASQLLISQCYDQETLGTEVHVSLDDLLKSATFENDESIDQAIYQIVNTRSF